MNTLFKNAAAIITVDEKDRVLHNADLFIEGNVIRAIGALEESHLPPHRRVEAEGCFLYPGLVNTHHHLYQTFTRNLPGVQNMELFPWLTALYEIWRGLDENAVYYSALTGMAELVKYGCTTVMDHHYVFPKAKGECFIDAQFQAAEALGVRFYATRGSMSRGKADGGLPPDDLVQDVDTILKDSERLVKKYHDDSPLSMGQMGIAPCSPFSVSTELLKESAKLARSLHVRLHTHLCETKDEEAYCQSLHGMRPLAYMESCGWLGRDVWYAHGIHFNDEELRLLADTGTGIAHCPTSNMKLSSGVCRLPELLALQVPVGLAVDGSASNDGSNLLAELRIGYLLHRHAYSGKAPSGYDMLKLATRGGAALLGREDIGSLEIGKAADLFMIDTRKLELAGATGDPANLLCTVGHCAPTKITMINGRVVSENGRLCTIEEESTRQKAEALARELNSK